MPTKIDEPREQHTDTQKSPFVAAARKVSRMSMLSGLVVTSAVFGAACSSSLSPPVLGAGLGPNQDAAAGGGTYSDTDILNFALNLEYLEAEFYNVAVNGKTIEQMGVPISGTYGGCVQGQTTGGAQVTFSDQTELGIAKAIANDELNHVLDIRGVLGADAVSKPAINLNALGIGFKNAMSFLVLARAFEDTGVSAYSGAAPLISAKDVLSAAAKILAVEGYHSGSIRTMIAQQNIPTNPPGPLDSLDILPPPSGPDYFFDDAHALAIARTPQQVLAIVKPFFPNGLNGAIH